MKKFIIHTDGSCPANPGPGGWGAVIFRPKTGKMFEISGGHHDTTNSRMEMEAVVQALNYLTDPASVVVYTDSQYVQKGISEWIGKWKKNGWQTSQGEPVKNRDLWKRLDRARNRHIRVVFQWVKGHAGDEGNERADYLAGSAVPLRSSATKSSARSKNSSRNTAFSGARPPMRRRLRARAR